MNFIVGMALFKSGTVSEVIVQLVDELIPSIGKDELNSDKSKVQMIK